jgi:ATP-binding cassette ChvD family protein
VLLKDTRLSFFRGAKIGVLGVNGSGKSSLLKIISGVDQEHHGVVWRKPDVKFMYLAQEPQLDPALDVKGNVRLGIAEQEALVQKFDEIAMKMGETDADLDKLLEEQAELQGRIEALDCWNVEHRVDTVMKALHLPPPDASIISLSGGERRRVALCRMLLEQPDVLLLDEPTNHLDADSVAWLERLLQEYRGTVIAVTHDRYFLDNIARWVLEVDRGLLLPFQGNYTQWLEHKAARLDLERGKEAAQARALQAELEWIRQRSKQASKARVKAVEVRRIEQQGLADKIHQLETGKIVIPPGPRLGDRVMTVENLSKRVSSKVLFENVSFDLEAGAIVGVIGANGCGKSTLFNVLCGRAEPDAGSVQIGSTVSLGLVSQVRDQELDDRKSVYEEVAQSEDVIVLEGRTVHTRAYLAAFNLKGSMQEKLVGSLSGGERNRVHLAKVMKRRHNLLFLDEPSNDLDVQTLRALEEALREFPGCSVVISHDRWFLDRVCTHTLAFEGAGSVKMFTGNYTEYVAHRAQRGRKKGQEGEAT